MALNPAERLAVENALRHARALAQVGRHATGLVKELEKLLAGEQKEAARPTS